MERIQADVAEVRSRLLSAEGPLRSLTVDEGGVDLLVSTRDHARAVRVTAVLVEPGDYPATPALLTCDDDPETARALAPLGPEFQDAAPVAKLVRGHVKESVCVYVRTGFCGGIGVSG